MLVVILWFNFLCNYGFVKKSYNKFLIIIILKKINFIYILDFCIFCKCYYVYFF